MKVFIRSIAAISPQRTFGGVPFLEDIVAYQTNRLQAIEPDYKTYIDPRQSRRMSRIVRMGVAAALECLRNAAVESADAIVTGTAYGCLEDTGIFLSRLIEQNEEALSPTAFIQSTHNTVGAQIAITLKATGYNNTFVHKAFSFESALLDSILLLKEEQAKTTLIGGIDELTNASFDILSRFGLYKNEPISNVELINSNTQGTIAGEGAAFFLLSSTPTENDHAELVGITTFYKPSAIEKNIETFLSSHGLTMNGISCVISGKNGDNRYSHLHDALEKGIFYQKNILYYKHLCGEYPTSSSFALWMGANILKQRKKEDNTENVLIYNNYQNDYHSLMLLSGINK